MRLIILKNSLYLECEALREDTFDKKKLEYLRKYREHKRFKATATETELEYSKDSRSRKPEYPEVEAYQKFYLNFGICLILDFWEEYDNKRGETVIAVYFKQSSEEKRIYIKGTLNEFLQMLSFRDNPDNEGSTITEDVLMDISKEDEGIEREQLFLTGTIEEED